MCTIETSGIKVVLRIFKASSNNTTSVVQAQWERNTMGTTHGLESTPRSSGLGWRNKELPPSLWFKNHEYSTLMWKDWSYYQSMSSEFRYDFRKVLGTQNRLTHGLPSTHCFLRLNLIKEMFNIVFYTHTHTNMHLTINMASNIPKPNIHLSYLSTKPSIHLSWCLFQGNNKSW